MSDGSAYDQRRYYALALDPIHAGAGGYRLGRVDLSIVREPGDQLPKVPGSSLSGAARAFAAMRTPGKARCSGKGGDFGDEHCALPDCPVCVAFGFSNGRTRQSLQGMAQFFDARILFFPVHSMVGPVWVTSPNALAHAGMDRPPSVAQGRLRVSPGLRSAPGQKLSHLNLGWLLLPAGDELPSSAVRPAGWPDPLPEPLKQIVERTVLLSDELFSRVVNDNLEVRTSVAIEQETGAADEGALFTYEALPRTTLLYFDVVYNDPRRFQIDRKPIPQTLDGVRSSVERGLEVFQHLGVGGMNTRGMGRLKVFLKAEV